MSLEAIEKAICEAGSDNHEVFGGTWTGGYLIQQDPKEFAELVECLQKNGPFGNYLAIGVAAGGNERFLIENVDIGSLVVIDNGEHPNFKHFDRNLAGIGSHPPYGGEEVFIGNSHSKSAAKFIHEICDETTHKFELVGIDGDHSPEGVLQDWELVQPFLAPGAIVWYHDTKMPIPGQHGARKLFARLKTQHEVLLETDGRFGIGCIRI